MLIARVRQQGESFVVVAEPYEWEPRARCYVCAGVESRVKPCPRCRGEGFARGESCPRCEGSGEVANRRANCDRCGGTGFVGEPRPDEVMLAIDVAWSDEGHVRLIGPGSSRKRGEGLFRLHRHR